MKVLIYCLLCLLVKHNYIYIYRKTDILYIYMNDILDYNLFVNLNLPLFLEQFPKLSKLDIGKKIDERWEHYKIWYGL